MRSEDEGKPTNSYALSGSAPRVRRLWLGLRMSGVSLDQNALGQDAVISHELQISSLLVRGCFWVVGVEVDFDAGKRNLAAFHKETGSRVRSCHIRTLRRPMSDGVGLVGWRS